MGEAAERRRGQDPLTAVTVEELRTAVQQQADLMTARSNRAIAPPPTGDQEREETSEPTKSDAHPVETPAPSWAMPYPTAP